MRKSQFLMKMIILYGLLHISNTACQSNQYLSGNQCYNCAFQCGSCTSLYNCTTCRNSATQENPPTCSCITGYYWSSTVCSKCVLPCITCTSSSVCTSCLDPVNQSLPYCKCATNQYQDTYTKKCYNCTSPCASCTLNTSTYCVSCVDGYYYQAQKCYPCTKPCATCYTSSTACTSCIDSVQIYSGWSCSCPSTKYMDSTTSFCYDCVSPCLECTTATKCTSCVDTYLLSETSCLQCTKPCGKCSGTVTSCTSCIDPANQITPTCKCTATTKYLDPTTYMCLNCVSPCLTCSTSSSCLSCIDQTYFLQGNSCIPCTSPCSTCISASYCTSCIDDTYALINNVCVQCTKPCLQCKDSVTQCTQCIDILNQQTPQCGCTNQSQYLEQNTFTCQNCTSPCITCISPIYCSQCIDDTYVLIDNACVACTKPCFKCKILTTQCTQCIDEINQSPPSCECTDQYQYLDQATYTCINCVSPCATCISALNCTSCIDDTYVLINNACVACTKPCLKCKDSVTQCTQCIDETYQIIPSCACANHQYLDKNTFTCQNCISPCASCTSDNFCTQCLDNYSLIDNFCVQCTKPCFKCKDSITQCTQCIDETNQQPPSCACENQGQYLDTNTYTCQNCISPCANCISNKQCTSCIDDTYLLIDDGCVPCTKPCLKCSISTTNCTSCVDNQNQSIPSCKCLLSTQYLDQTNYNCIDCPKPCFDCQSATQCTSCINNGYILIDYKCIACEAPCLTCAGSVTKCTSCIDEKNQNPPSCDCSNSGQYQDQKTFTCMNCQGPCKECLNSETNCLSCIDEINQLPPTCQCQNGYVLDPNTLACNKCTFPCESCQQETTNCITCASTYKYDPQQQICQCEITQFELIGSPSICHNCSSPCETCSHESTHCESCLDGFDRHLDQNKCICNDGYFEQDTTCQKCSLPCLKCSSQTICLSCFSELQELPYCQCKQTYYMDDLFECQQCQQPCENCSNTQDCKTCQIKYYLTDSKCLSCKKPCSECIDTPLKCTSCLDNNATIQSNQCICNDGYYMDIDLNCQPCHYSCAKCELNYRKCTYCTSTYELIKNSCVCPKGYFDNLEQEITQENKHQCSKCQLPCITCQTAANQCTSCSENHELSNYSCQCKSGYGQSGENGINCSPCQQPCLECSISTTTCTSCINNDIYFLKDNQCQCRQGYFQNQNNCLKCQSNCSICEGIDYCTQCLEGYYLENNQCLKCINQCRICISEQICAECFEGFYLDQTNSQCFPCLLGCSFCNDLLSCIECSDGYYKTNATTCNKCDDKCKTCSGEGICTDCYSNSELIQNSCQCKDGYFERDSQCIKCQSPCFSCTNEYNCTKCAGITNLYFDQNGLCICKDGYFWKDQFCYQCDQNCLTCAENSTKCLTCDIKGYRILNKNFCDCQSEYFDDNDKFCIPCKSEQGKLERKCQIKDSADKVWTYGEQCDDGNDIMRDGCSNFIIDYNYSCTNVILQKSICFQCQDKCSKCIQNEQILCVSCESGYFLQNNQCTQCPDKCVGCEADTGVCNTCRFIKDSKGQCHMCEYKAGYYSNFQTNQCYTVCGDSQVVEGVEECDDGNRLNGDGCDQNCKQEQKFMCQDAICIQPYPTPKITQTGKAPLFSNTRSFNISYNLELQSISGFDLKAQLSVFRVSQKNTLRILQEGDGQQQIMDQKQKQPFNIDYQINQNQDGHYQVSATLTIQLNQSSEGEDLLVKFKGSNNVCSSLGYCQQDIETRLPIEKYILIDQATSNSVESIISISKSIIIILIMFGLITLLFGNIKIFFNLLEVLQILSYLKYINIQYPYNLETIFDFFGFAKLNQVLNLLSINYTLYLPDTWGRLLPAKIQEDGYNSLLLINCFSFLTLWVILIGVYFLSLLGLQLKKKIQVRLDSSDSKIQVALKIYLMDFKFFINSLFLYFTRQFYNVIIRTHISTSYDYCFLMILQLFAYQIRSNSPEASFSSFLFILSLIIYIVLIYKITSLSYKKYYELDTLKAKLTYGTIFESVDKQKYNNIQSIILVKKLIFIFLLVFGYPNTIYQILSLFCLMILSCVVLFSLKPYDDNSEYYKQLSSEIIITLLFGLVLLLAMNEEIHLNINDEAVGWFCAFIIISILLIQLFFSTHQLWDQLFQKYKIMRKIAYYMSQFFFKQQDEQSISPNVLTEVEF